MLKFKELVICTEKKRELFKTDELHLGSGIVALVGRNGAGKSTLFRTIMGGHFYRAGAIEVEGREVKNYRREELAKKVAIVFSKATVFGKHTGRDLLFLGRLPYQNMFSIKTQEDRDYIERIIILLDLHDFIDQEFTQMSDGEKQLVMIGRAMAQDTPIILLDEPNAFLDLVNRHKVMNVLRKIGGEANKLVLFSTHEIDFLPDLCDSVLLIDQGYLIKIDDKNAFIPTIKSSFGINS